MDKTLFKIQLIKIGKPAVQVAREIPVDPSTLSRWVRGWYPVPQQLRRRLAEILDLSVAELFSEEQSNATV